MENESLYTLGLDQFHGICHHQPFFLACLSYWNFCFSKKFFKFLWTLLSFSTHPSPSPHVVSDDYPPESFNKMACYIHILSYFLEVFMSAQISFLHSSPLSGYVLLWQGLCTIIQKPWSACRSATWGKCFLPFPLVLCFTPSEFVLFRFCYLFTSQ